LDAFPFFEETVFFEEVVFFGTEAVFGAGFLAAGTVWLFFGVAGAGLDCGRARDAASTAKRNSDKLYLMSKEKGAALPE